MFPSQDAPTVSMAPVSTTPVATLPPVSTTPAEFATGTTDVVDTGGKLARGVNGTGDK
jgi:hypothetical protein